MTGIAVCGLVSPRAFTFEQLQKQRSCLRRMLFELRQEARPAVEAETTRQLPGHAALSRSGRAVYGDYTMSILCLHL